MLPGNRIRFFRAVIVFTPLFRSGSSMPPCRNNPKGRLPLVSVKGSGETEVNVIFRPQDPLRIPAGFDRTCKRARWNTQDMWDQLSDGNSPWFEADNESYILESRK